MDHLPNSNLPAIAVSNKSTPSAIISSGFTTFS
jgi:hypothetical protein